MNLIPFLLSVKSLVIMHVLLKVITIAMGAVPLSVILKDLNVYIHLLKY